MTTVSFKDQAVIVTGAGGALGRSYAMDIARRGGAVVVNDLGGTVEGASRSRGTADKVVDEIRAAGGRAIANYDNVATAHGARHIVSAALDIFGRLDALINNAGNFRVASFEEVSGDDLDSLISTHLIGSFNVTQAAWPHMKAQRYGRIVFTTSSGGMFGKEQLSAYGAAKGGITGLMNVVSQEGAPHGVLCNALMPNAMSRMGAALAGKNPQIRQSNPLAEAFLPTLDPAFNTGIAVYLASNACTTSHSIYSSLGGRVARVFVGINDGWQGSRERPATAEDIAEHIDLIRDTSGSVHVPASQADEFRIIASRLADRPG